MTEIKTCTCGRKIKIPLERIEDIEHLIRKHKGYFKAEPSQDVERAKEGWMTEVFYLPKSTWKAKE